MLLQTGSCDGSSVDMAMSTGSDIGEFVEGFIDSEQSGCGMGSLCNLQERLGPDEEDILWIQCTLCTRWYHWVCTGMDLMSPVDGEWFCSPCDLWLAATRRYVVTTSH
jgi:hypothetical protein